MYLYTVRSGRERGRRQQMPPPVAGMHKVEHFVIDVACRSCASGLRAWWAERVVPASGIGHHSELAQTHRPDQRAIFRRLYDDLQTENLLERRKPDLSQPVTSVSPIFQNGVLMLSPFGCFHTVCADRFSYSLRTGTVGGDLRSWPNLWRRTPCLRCSLIQAQRKHCRPY